MLWREVGHGERYFDSGQLSSKRKTQRCVMLQVSGSVCCRVPGKQKEKLIDDLVSLVQGLLARLGGGR